MTETPTLRPHAEQEYADELTVLRRLDDRPARHAGGCPRWAVVTYLMGGLA